MQEDKPEVWEAVKKVLSYLGAGLANVVNTFNPETVIIGGWPLKVGRRGLDYLEGIVHTRAMEGLADGVSLYYSGLDEDGPLIGAYTLVLESFFNPTFPHLSKVIAQREKSK